MGRARTATGDDEQLLERLRVGDEEAFVTLVGRHNHALFFVARSFVPTDAIAEEVVQDTWMAVVRGLSNFEGRSSIKTWLVRIAVNRASLDWHTGKPHTASEQLRSCSRP